MVADFFCGSGTTALVAAQHDRRFIASDESLRAIHTTRSRLVRLPSPPFSIQIDDQTQISYKKPEKKIQFSIDKGLVSILGKLEGVDYWEVDPDWDGITFKSKAQAARSVRSGDVAQSLKIRTGRKICIRWVMASGSHFQVELDV
jgi:hypothetical protein